MFFGKVPGSATLAMTLWASVAIAGGAPPLPVEGRAEFVPMQSTSYAFGSKLMSGYFVQESVTCVVTLMISEKSDPEHLLPMTPTRIHLMLNPGQIAGLDSQEERSVNLTCGEGAGTLLVDVGQRAPGTRAR